MVHHDYSSAEMKTFEDAEQTMYDHIMYILEGE